ncbi:hypothetical protein [Lutimonas zeaxanthinifaciens]|uniref:hypothetical protein n=1 Tax=Lutimonas zeaxanthinifaciens TaxID=3060215 RepID=UPI00265CC092|nr:hypothetical protein [Lutimonas sp. YSD2104]WKK64832.1 hypothetical protein QZH61_09565 [Lutimonas sp. YSD2104]
MKNKIQLLIAILLVVPMLCIANPLNKKWDYEKTKTIKKEYNVNADAALNIKNKYGNVDVISWDQNRVVIEVTITVSGNNESKVEDRLSKIDVKFENSSSYVSAETKFNNNSKSWWNSGNKMSYQIDYKVKVPVTNSVDLNNDYGTISLNEIKGQAEINCDYGKVLIGSLYHNNNSINIDYTSDSEIELMNGGSINADYSKFRVEKANKIELNADYTNSEFVEIEDLEFNCDYGKIEVDKAGSVEGNGDYLTMRFGTIKNKLHIDADYGSIKVAKMMNGFNELYVHSDYAGIKVGLDKGAAFNFKVELSYGGFEYDGEGINYNKKIVKSQSKYYEGYVKNQNSGSNVDISSEYGGVKLYNN